MPELDVPPPPDEVVYLLGWFVDIAAGRQAGMGVSPLAWVEIEAWFRLSDIQPTPFELATIRALDAAFLRVTNAEHGN